VQTSAFVHDPALSDAFFGSVLGPCTSVHHSIPHLLYIFVHLLFSNTSTQMILNSSLLCFLLVIYPTSTTSHSVFLPYILGSALMVWLSTPISQTQLSLVLVSILVAILSTHLSRRRRRLYDTTSWPRQDSGCNIGQAPYVRRPRQCSLQDCKSAHYHIRAMRHIRPAIMKIYQWLLNCDIKRFVILYGDCTTVNNYI